MDVGFWVLLGALTVIFLLFWRKSGDDMKRAEAAGNDLVVTGLMFLSAVVVAIVVVCAFALGFVFS